MRLRRHAFALSVASLATVIVGAGLFLLVVALPELQRTTAAPDVDPASSPRPSAGAIAMQWLNLPANADCAACHATDAGIGVRTIPTMAHPLKGWTNCTACHSDEKLVQTAPGHSGIHATDCLMCHQAASADMPAPLSRPHRDLQNQECLSCHGSTAPLPSDMSHRTQTVCWLCHRLPQVEPPLATHRVTPGEKDCLNCHVAGEVGALPADHAARTNAECMLCHEPREMTPSFGPPASNAVSYVPTVPITSVGWWPEVAASR